MSTPADSREPILQETGSRNGGAPVVVVSTWTSEQLLGTANEARIVHGNEVYRLLRTRNQKLILVK